MCRQRLLLLVLTIAALRANASRSVPNSSSGLAGPAIPVPISYLTTEVAAAQDDLKLNGAGIKIAIMDRCALHFTGTPLPQRPHHEQLQPKAMVLWWMVFS